MFKSSHAPTLDCDVDGDWGAYADGDWAFDIEGDLASWDAEVGDVEMELGHADDTVGLDARPVGELLAHLVTLPPSGFVMSTLLTIDRSALSDVEAVTFLQLHQRVAGWWASVQAEVVLVAASPEPMIEE